MTREDSRKEVVESQGKFADLYRDIRGQFSKGRPLRCVLKHIRMNTRGGDASGDQSVSVWETDHFDGKDPNEFAQDVITDIMEDAKIFPATMQRYALYFYTKNTDQHSHRIFIMIRGGGPEDSGDVFANEGPDDEGRRAQIMRHDEGFVRLNLVGLKQTLDSKDKTIDRYERMLDKMIDQFVPVLTAIKDITVRTAEMDFDLERKRKLYDMLDQFGNQAIKVAPGVAAHMLKNKSPELAQVIAKAAYNPADDILSMFIKEMEQNPDKAQQIFASVMALPNGQMLLAALQQHAQAKKAAEQALAKTTPAPNGTVTPKQE